MRALDIGPGPTHRIPGFEGLDAVRSPLVDHVADCRRLPFKDGAFDIVHSSHVLEHMEWWEVEAVVAEWARVVAPGGRLEIWVPNGRAIMEALIAYEDRGEAPPALQGGKVFRRTHQNDPYLGLVSMLMNLPLHGNDLQRHRAIITPAYLEAALVKAGLVRVRRLTDDERRGFDHGWFNLGMVGERA